MAEVVYIYDMKVYVLDVGLVTNNGWHNNYLSFLSRDSTQPIL